MKPDDLSTNINSKFKLRFAICASSLVVDHNRVKDQFYKDGLILLFVLPSLKGQLDQT